MATIPRRYVDIYDKLNDLGDDNHDRSRLETTYNGANSRQSSLASVPTANPNNNVDKFETTMNDGKSTGNSTLNRYFRAGSFYSAPAVRNRNASVGGGSSMGTGDGARSIDGRRRLFRERSRIGNRTVKDGVVYYKKVSTDELKRSIQFGIYHFLKEQNRNNSHDMDVQQNLGMHDFHVVETIPFPKTGSSKTPSHEFTDFQLKVYAPNSFRYLRRTFNIEEDDFIHAIGEADLKEVANPGASGAVFYKTSNDRYILKTIRHQETEVLKSFLRYYTLHLLQNKINQRFSFLPTLYGLFNYQKVERTSLIGNRLNIRLMVMNNILPSDIQIHEKYDLKGSSVNRKAGPEELAKTNPTYKDTDFIERHPNGIEIDETQYDNVINSIKRDCMFLESFGIMDYSLLLGIHNIDKSRYNRQMEDYYNTKLDELSSRQNSVFIHNDDDDDNGGDQSPTNLSTFYGKFPRGGLANQISTYSHNFFNLNAFPARSSRGERLLLYIGIIDILQSYQINKKIEHTLKSMIADSKKISVSNPKFYIKRFVDFITISVFKRSNLKKSIISKPITFGLDKRTSVSQQSIAESLRILNRQQSNQSINSRPIGFDITEATTTIPTAPPEPLTSPETYKRPRINSVYSNRINTIEEETPSLKLAEEKEKEKVDKKESDEIDSKKPKPIPIGFEDISDRLPTAEKEKLTKIEDTTTSNDESYISDESTTTKSRNESISVQTDTDDLMPSINSINNKKEEEAKRDVTKEQPEKVPHYKGKKIPPPLSFPSNTTESETSVDLKTPTIFKRSKVDENDQNESKAEFWPYRDPHVEPKPKSISTLNLSQNNPQANYRLNNNIASNRNQLLKNIVNNLPTSTTTSTGEKDKPAAKNIYQFSPTMYSKKQSSSNSNEVENRQDEKNSIKKSIKPASQATEFTVVKKKPVHDKIDLFMVENGEDDTYEIKSLDGRKLYDKYRNKYDNHLKEVEEPKIAAEKQQKPKLPVEFQPTISSSFLNRHVSSFTSSSSLDQVTSFTVDKTQMRRNFMRGASNLIINK